jgi:hypothetical protein
VRFFCSRIRIAMQETKSQSGTIVECEFGSEADVERITGRKRKTLQKDRLFGRGFPYYKFGGQIRYNLAEVRSLLRSSRVDAGSGQSGASA